MDCCTIVCIIIGIIIGIAILKAVIEESGKRDAERRKNALLEKQRKEEEERERNYTIDRYRSLIRNESNAFYKDISNFFSLTSNSDVNVICSNLSHHIIAVKDAHSNLNLLCPSDAENNINIINKLTADAEDFRKFASVLSNADYKTMINMDDYGNANKEYWDIVMSLDSETVKNTLDIYNIWMTGESQLHNLSAICPTLIPAFVWFYATEKPYSVNNFEYAKNTFKKIYKSNFTDLTIAEFYAIKQMGGDDVLRERVRNLIKDNTNTQELMTLASGLMWMNAYQEENMILQHMLNTGQQLSAKAQNRLHALTHGGGKAPDSYSIEAEKDELYFDVRSLAWKDEDSVGMFDNLVFQEKDLTYSLALRDEDKELIFASNLMLPDRNVLLNKMNNALAEEYGELVKAKMVDCIALSGNIKEKMDGYLVATDELKQLGILVHIARIGKKLIIKFYTLFMPHGSLIEQKQEVLALYKRISPSANMWENSIKDTILMVMKPINRIMVSIIMEMPTVRSYFNSGLSHD